MISQEQINKHILRYSSYTQLTLAIMDLFKFLSTATVKPSLQQLVDDHARAGLPNDEINPHLREAHDVAADVLIPPPTRAAQRARERDSAGPRIMINNETQTIDIVIPPGSDKTPEFYRESFKQTLIELGHSTPENADSQMVMTTSAKPALAGLPYERMYQPSGPTLLDRVVHGFSQWFHQAHPDEAHGSNFEIYRRVVNKFHARAGYSLDFRCNDAPYKMLHAAMHPWFQDNCRTKNIQIDSDFAEILFNINPPAEKAWIGDLTQQPFYLDIQEHWHGERSISGIFCTPTPDGKGFTFSIVVEWAKQGFESIISGQYPLDDSNPCIIMAFSEDTPPPEAVDELYGELILDALHILSTSSMYLKSQENNGVSLQTLSKSETSAGRSSAKKKQRNKGKTHSYFIVKRMEMPTDRFGQKGPIEKGRWSLDHIVNVSGHLRWQACGPNRSQHKLIWIDSYEKGEGSHVRPEISPILERIVH